MRTRLTLASFALISFGSNLAICKDSPHNVLFIITDDQGYGDLSFNGNTLLETGHIDKFASESIVLDRFMMNAVSAPSRAATLTGRYHIRTGVTWVTRRREVMNQNEYTIGELFRDAGYATGYFGKWHNGAQYPHNPNGQGFNDFIGFCAGHWERYFNPVLERNGSYEECKGYIADVITDECIDFIDRNRDSSFFAYLAFNTPHAPFQVPDKYFSKYKKKGLDDKTAAIYGMCENIDDNFGRIISYLKKNGLYDNTIIIFTSDNGPFGIRYNAGMKGQKASVHEGGVRVPFFIKPDRKTEHKVISEICANIDIYPTLAEMCGINIPANISIDGQSFADMLYRDRSEPDNRIIFSHNQPWYFREAPAGAVRTNRYRLVLEQTNDTLLYDMLKDPGQLMDIAGDEPQIVSELLGLYHDWFMEVTGNGQEPSAEPIEIGHKGFDSVEMPAHEAWLGKGVYYAGKQGWANDWAVGFKSGKGEIIWKTRNVIDGVYEIYADYSLGEKYTGFEVNVKIGDIEMSNTLDKPFVYQNPEQDEIPFNHRSNYREWGRFKIGTVYIKKGFNKIKLTVDGISEDNDFAVKGIIVRKR